MTVDAFRDLTGARVTGTYYGNSVAGVVRESRIRYSDMIHYVDFDAPTEISGSVRDGVLLKSSDIVSIL